MNPILNRLGFVGYAFYWTVATRIGDYLIDYRPESVGGIIFTSMAVPIILFLMLTLLDFIIRKIGGQNE